jgi:tetratricopeptide (TPR) repeat protein
LLGLARAQRRSGKIRDARATLERLLAKAPARAWRIRAQAKHLLGRVTLIMGDRKAARRHYQSAARLAERARDAPTRARIALQLADAYGDIDGARRALAMMRALGDPLEEAFAHWVFGRLCRGRGRFVDAETHFEQCLTRTRAIGECYLEALAMGSLARARHHAGRLEDALETYEVALRMHRRSGNEAMARWAAVDLGAAQHEVGLGEAAQKTLSQALSACREEGDSAIEIVAIAQLALLRMVHAPEEAKAMLRLVAKEGKPSGNAELVVLARAAALVAGESHSERRIRELSALGARAGTGSDRDVAVIAFIRIASRGPRAELGPGENVRRLETAADVLVDPGTGSISVADRVIELGIESPLFRIATALAEKHRAAPNSAMTDQELIARGWPSEHIAANAASNRLRNAIARLRKAGLQGTLLTRTDGYLLSPDCVVRISRERAAARVDAPHERDERKRQLW